jgi:predicted nucleotidyltransferase
MMQHPDEGLEVGMLTQLTGRSQKDVERALKILATLDLVVVLRSVGGILGHVPTEEYLGKDLKERGRTRYYLNKSNPWIPPLRTLLECAIGGLEVLREKLLELDGIEVAFVYGSFATSEQSPDSDIDLAVIGEQTLETLSEPVREVERRIGREISPVAYTPEVWRKKFLARSYFSVELMQSPKIFLVGDNSVLDKIIMSIPDEA